LQKYKNFKTNNQKNHKNDEKYSIVDYLNIKSPLS